MLLTAQLEGEDGHIIPCHVHFSCTWSSRTTPDCGRRLAVVLTSALPHASPVSSLFFSSVGCFLEHLPLVARGLPSCFSWLICSLVPKSPSLLMLPSGGSAVTVTTFGTFSKQVSKTVRCLFLTPLITPHVGSALVTGTSEAYL